MLKNLKKIISNFYPEILFFGFSILVLLYTLVRDQLIWDGQRFDDYLKYYIFGLLLLFLSFLSLFLNKKIKQNIILILTSTYLSLLLLEAGLNFINYNKHESKKKIFYKSNNYKINENSLYLEYFQSKDKNNLYVKVWPKYFLNKNLEIFPLSSISYSNIIYCNENGYFSKYKTDRYGFNNPDDVWDNEKLDYVLIGDSFVEGACVNSPYDISGQLRKISNKKIINLGQAGFGPLSQLGSYIEYMKNKKVKNIIWFYYEENDSIDLIHEKKDYLLKSYLFEKNYSQNLINDKKNSKKNKIVKEFSNLRLKKLYESHIENTDINLKIKRFITLHNFKNKIFSKEAEIPLIDKDFFKILKKIKKISDIHESNLIFVYLPSYNTFTIKKPRTNLSKNYVNIKKFLNEEKIAFIDIYQDMFEKSLDPFIYFPLRQDGHYNKKGYRKIAEIINNYDLEN
tara:strand:+ start:64 stop:1425 length:1362 start_codon:yes stop_codon:yes gene_type:complete